MKLPGQAVATIKGHLLAFYDLRSGTPRILAQVTSESALPLTYVIPFKISKTRGVFGTDLVAPKMREIEGICRRSKYYSCFEQPYAFKGIYGRISKFEMSLFRKFINAGKTESFVSDPECAAHGHRVFPLERQPWTTMQHPRLAKLL